MQIGRTLLLFNLQEKKEEWVIAGEHIRHLDYVGKKKNAAQRKAHKSIKNSAQELQTKMKKNFEEGKYGYENIDFNYYMDEIDQQSGRSQLLFEIQQLEHECLLAM